MVFSRTNCLMNSAAGPRDRLRIRGNGPSLLCDIIPIETNNKNYFPFVRN